MFKRPTGSAYIGSIINYLIYGPAPFPRGLEVELEGSSTFLTLILSLHIDRLGLFSHFYGYLFNYITACQGSFAGAAALCIEVRWCCTIVVSDWYSAHQLPGCKCTLKVSHAPLGNLKAVYIGIYSHIQP